MAKLRRKVIFSDRVYNKNTKVKVMPLSLMEEEISKFFSLNFRLQLKNEFLLVAFSDGSRRWLHKTNINFAGC